MSWIVTVSPSSSELYHHGVKGMKWGHHKPQEDLEIDNSNGGRSITKSVKNKLTTAKAVDNRNRANKLVDKMRQQTNFSENAQERAFNKMKATYIVNQLKIKVGATKLSSINNAVKDKINAIPSISKIQKMVLSKIDAGKKAEEKKKAEEAVNKIKSGAKSKFGKK